MILATLGTIMTGLATPTEGAALGCLGSFVVTAFNRKLTFKIVKDSCYRTVETTSMVMILLAVCLQTCWLSPPVALSAYYLKGVEPSWELIDIYRG